MKLIERWVDPKTEFRWHRFEGCDIPLISVTSTLAHIVPRRLKTYFKQKSATEIKKTSRLTTKAGTELHEHIEELFITGQIPTVEREYEPLIKKVKAWKETKQIETIGRELTVAYPELGYAGTLDMVWRYTGEEYYYENGEKKVRHVENALRIVDIKTGYVSTTHGWQLAAYRMAYQRGIDEDIGMSVLQCNYKNNTVEMFAYTHLDFCTNMYLAALDTWKGLYYNKLKYPVVSPTGVEMRFPYLNDNAFCRHYGNMSFSDVNYLLRRGK